MPRENLAPYPTSKYLQRQENPYSEKMHLPWRTQTHRLENSSAIQLCLAWNCSFSVKASVQKSEPRASNQKHRRQTRKENTWIWFSGVHDPENPPKPGEEKNQIEKQLRRELCNEHFPNTTLKACSLSVSHNHQCRLDFDTGPSLRRINCARQQGLCGRDQESIDAGSHAKTINRENT